MPEMEPAPSGPLFQTPPLHAVNQLFDYASFLWDTGTGTGDIWQQMSPAVTTGQGVTFDALGQNGHNPVVPSATINSSPQASINMPMQSRLIPSSYDNSEPSTVPDTSCTGYAEQDDLLVPSETVAAENHRLMDYFAHAVTPPILAEVETQKNWFAMRQVLVGMSNASRMIRWAILAFSNLMLCRRDGNWLASQQNHYDNAAAEVAAYDSHPAESFLKQSADRTNLLATLFFLSYVDILEARIKTAHTHLKRAYNIFQNGDKASFTPIEKQFLLWIRLLDGRAVSAGGDGLFLEKDEEPLLVDVPSPNILKTATGPEPREDDLADDDIEDTLFQVLYQPGILFFQKVQSFMGRISKIDPWHRPRGTVEDETEVMNTGQSIAADLRALYDQRPPLMDIAVAGRLTPPHVSAHLAAVVTRAFRTYLSNYYASKVHLHRVAYKAFPLTAEAAEALAHIRRLAGLLAEGLDGEDDALPVNMLWPLLMLGSEQERDPGKSHLFPFHVFPSFRSWNVLKTHHLQICSRSLTRTRGARVGDEPDPAHGKGRGQRKDHGAGAGGGPGPAGRCEGAGRHPFCHACHLQPVLCYRLAPVSGSAVSPPPMSFRCYSSRRVSRDRLIQH